MKLCMQEVNIHIKGTETQIFLIGPSFCFMKFRKKRVVNIHQKFPLFSPMKSKLEPK